MEKSKQYSQDNYILRYLLHFGNFFQRNHKKKEFKGPSPALDIFPVLKMKFPSLCPNIDCILIYGLAENH